VIEVEVNGTTEAFWGEVDTRGDGTVVTGPTLVDAGDAEGTGFATRGGDDRGLMGSAGVTVEAFLGVG
jgi:hypothetical protein